MKKRNKKRPTTANLTGASTMSNQPTTPDQSQFRHLRGEDLLGATVTPNADRILQLGVQEGSSGKVVGYDSDTLKVSWPYLGHGSILVRWGQEGIFEVNIIERAGDEPVTGGVGSGDLNSNPYNDDGLAANAPPSEAPAQDKPFEKGDRVKLMRTHRREHKHRIGESATVTAEFRSDNVVIKFDGSGRKMITTKKNLSHLQDDSAGQGEGQGDGQQPQGQQPPQQPDGDQQPGGDPRQQGQRPDQRPPEGQLEDELAKVFLPRIEFKPGELIDATGKQVCDVLMPALAKVGIEMGKRMDEIEADIKKQLKGAAPLVIKLPDMEPVTLEGAQHERLGSLIKAMAAGIPVMLVGPAGSGKSHGAHQAATALNLRYFAYSICQQTTASLLLGYMDAQGRYVRSLYREAYEFGGLVNIDEVDNGNANVLAVLNSSLSNGHCAFPDMMVPKHKDFRCVATANTWGSGRTLDYIGRNPIDGATLDRFAAMAWGYDERVENSMCPNEKWLAFVRAIRTQIEKRGVKHLVTPRAALYGARMLEAGMDKKEVAQTVVFKGLDVATTSAIIGSLSAPMAREFCNA